MLALACAALPLAAVAVIDPAGWSPFGPAKWAAVSVAVAALVVGLGSRHRLVVPARAALVWSVLLGWLLLATVVAAARGDDPIYVWVGTPERHLGLVTWMLFAVAFLAGAQLRGRAIRTFARAVVLAALFAGLYAVVERIGGRPVEYDAVSARLGGPFGSASYLGAAACLLVPVAAAMAADTRSDARWRVTAAVAAVTGIVVVVGSGARAAWVGLAVAAVVLALARPGARRILVGVAMAAAVGIAVAGTRLDDVVERDAGASSRLHEWRVAGRVLLAHPLVGTGPEGYRLAVAQGVDADYEREHGREVMPDRAHSGPLDVAVVGGAPAAIAYTVLLALAVAAAWCSLRRAAPLLAGLAGAVVAYAGQQLLLFPTAELDPIFWVMAGVVVAEIQPTRVVQPRTAVRRATQVGGAALVAVAAVTGLLGVAADRLAGRVVEDPAASTALADARRAVALRPDAVRYRLLEAAVAEQAGTLSGADAAVAATGRAADLAPGDPLVRRRAAEARSRRAAITGAEADVAVAVDAWRELLAGDPHCFACRLGLGDALALAGDAAGAEAAWRAADALTDRDPAPAQRLQELARQRGRQPEATAWQRRIDALVAG